MYYTKCFFYIVKESLRDFIKKLKLIYHLFTCKDTHIYIFKIEFKYITSFMYNERTKTTHHI